MTHDLRIELVVDRPHAEAATLFDRPLPEWLPAIVGPDERSWRVETREGPVHVQMEVETSSVFVDGGGTHGRGMRIRPDRTAMGNFIVAMLTPTVEGQLELAPRPSDPRTCILRFEGQSTARSRLTNALARFFVGDPLSRSGVRTLVEEARDRLSDTPLEDPDATQ